MNVTSSALPDAVQKLLGLPGGSAPLVEAALGGAIVALVVWGGLKSLKRIFREDGEK